MDVVAHHEDIRRAPKPHDILWYPDGNIILKTDTFLFRIHKGVLSGQSSVFKDMFDLSAGEEIKANDGEWAVEIVQDLFEGLPIVPLALDKGKDVAHLLRAVYERRCVSVHIRLFLRSFSVTDLRFIDITCPIETISHSK